MYYYFEVHVFAGKEQMQLHKTGPRLDQIENANRLMYKPRTNSTGVWGVQHLSDRPEEHPIGKTVLQYWIDTNKYANGEDMSCDVFLEHMADILKDQD